MTLRHFISLYWFVLVTSRYAVPVRAARRVLRACRQELPTAYRKQVVIETAECTVAREYAAGRTIEAQAHDACVRESGRVDPDRYRQFLDYGREVVARKKVDGRRFRLTEV